MATPPLLLVLLLLRAAPEGEERGLFLFELRRVPVGTVELSWEPGSGAYRYRSTHLFTRGQDRGALARTASFRLDAGGRTADGERLASWWAWRQPPVGECVRGREELGERRGALCLRALTRDGSASGSMLGEEFQARYEGGRLRELVIGPARFLAIPPGTAIAPPGDLFGEGFPIDEGGEGVLALEPGLGEPARVEGRPGAARAPWNEREARALARKVYEAFPDKRPGPADLGPTPGEEEEEEGVGSCAAHVRRFLRLARETGHEALAVHGLVAEPGEQRAWPHVWVRVMLGGGRMLDLDPTTLDEVTPRTHLPLAATRDEQAAGRVWLELFSGRYRVVRRAARGRPAGGPGQGVQP